MLITLIITYMCQHDVIVEINCLLCILVVNLISFFVDCFVYKHYSHKNMKLKMLTLLLQTFFLLSIIPLCYVHVDFLFSYWSSKWTSNRSCLYRDVEGIKVFPFKRTLHLITQYLIVIIRFTDSLRHKMKEMKISIVIIRISGFE